MYHLINQSINQQTGFELTLTHLDGKQFKLKIDDVIECDHVTRVPGKGMPRRSGRGHGDLYITFEVDFPDKLSDEQKAAIRKSLAGGGQTTGSANEGNSEL